MDEIAAPLKPEGETDDVFDSGSPETISNPELGVVIRDAGGNELRITERTELGKSLQANYEDLTAQATSAETIHGFRVLPARERRARAGHARSHEVSPPPKPSFDKGRFGESLEIVHDDGLHPGDVYVEPDADDTQKVIVRTGGPKTRVQATLTPAHGINLKMRRDDRRFVRMGWTPEEAKEAFGEEALEYTTEVARSKRSRGAGQSEASAEAVHVSEEAPTVVEDDNGDERDEGYPVSRSTERTPVVLSPEVDDEAEMDAEDDPEQRERLIMRAAKWVGKRLPRAVEVAALVGIGVGILVADRTPGGLAMQKTRGITPTGQTPNTSTLAGELGTTNAITVGPDDNLYNLVQNEVIQVNPGLKGNSAELADDTRAIMLVTEELNTTITDWRHLHAGEEVTLFNPAAVKGLLDVLDHKPGPRAPADMQQEWQELHDAFTGLRNVHGTHDQFDHDAFLHDPKVEGWIGTINTFMDNGGWLE